MQILGSVRGQQVMKIERQRRVADSVAIGVSGRKPTLRQPAFGVT